MAIRSSGSAALVVSRARLVQEALEQLRLLANLPLQIQNRHISNIRQSIELHDFNLPPVRAEDVLVCLPDVRVGAAFGNTLAPSNQASVGEIGSGQIGESSSLTGLVVLVFDGPATLSCWSKLSNGFLDFSLMLFIDRCDAEVPCGGQKLLYILLSGGAQSTFS